MNGRLAKVMFAASIAMNVFVLGAAAGAFFWRPSPAPPQQSGQSLATAAQALDPTLRQTFRQALVQARRDAKPDSEAALAGRDELAKLLDEPHLDRQAISTALENTRAADIRVRARMETAVIDFAEGLDPQDRAKFVESLSSRGQMLPRDEKK